MRITDIQQSLFNVMPEPPKGSFARKGTKAGHPPRNGSKRKTRMGAPSFPKKTGPRSSGRRSGRSMRTSRNEGLVFAPSPMSRGGFQLANGPKNTTRCEIVSRVFDVTPSAVGTIAVVLPATAADVVGAGCCHLGAGLSTRHTTLAAAFQRVRISAITFSWESLCSSTTTGVLGAAILSEYSHAAGVAAIPADYNLLLQKSGAVVFRPWATGQHPLLSWKKMDGRDGELQVASRNAYTRADDVQYLFMVRGEGLPTAQLPIGKIVVRIHLDYYSQE